MSNREPSRPEPRFVEDLYRHKAWGVAFAAGTVLLLGYLAWNGGQWAGVWP